MRLFRILGQDGTHKMNIHSFISVYIQKKIKIVVLDTNIKSMAMS